MLSTKERQILKNLVKNLTQKEKDTLKIELIRIGNKKRDQIFNIRNADFETRGK